MSSVNVLFLLLGAVMILSMHAGFAFLEAGSVSRKNQVNAFNKIIFDWSVTTIAYFIIGFPISYGIFLYSNTSILTEQNGFQLVRFFFLLGFAAVIPAIISGGIVGRMKFYVQSVIAIILGGLVYPFFESLAWGRNSFIMGSPDSYFAKLFGAPFHDFAGSAVVHSVGGWIGLAAILVLGPRTGRFSGKFNTRPSSIPFLTLGSWILIVGWFGFNVMSSQNIENISGLVAINSLMAMVGGTITGLIFSKNDVGFTHNGALAGLVAICAGSDVVHPFAALLIGGIAGIIFMVLFELEAKWKIDDVLGIWPLHGVNGTWGGIAAGIFGRKALGGQYDLSFLSQLSGSVLALVYSFAAGFIVYKVVDIIVGLRISEHQELIGADLTFHRIDANPEQSL